MLAEYRFLYVYLLVLIRCSFEWRCKLILMFQHVFLKKRIDNDHCFSSYFYINPTLLTRHDDHHSPYYFSIVYDQWNLILSRANHDAFRPCLRVLSNGFSILVDYRMYRKKCDRLQLSERRKGFFYYRIRRECLNKNIGKK